jgi:hypothetical protein
MNVGTLDRRGFLQSATGLLTGLLAAGSPLAVLAPSRAWALDLTALTTQEGVTLLAAARTIAPHDAGTRVAAGRITRLLLSVLYRIGGLVAGEPARVLKDSLR